MVLVLLGTQNNSFHRLLEKIEECINNKIIDEEVIVQAGYTKFESANMKIFDLIPKDELEKIQEKANFVITHGGVGSIVSSIERDKKVIAVPRLHEYEEHVNNHQLEIVQDFNKKGYIIGINKVEELEEAIKKLENFIPKKYKQNNEKMLNIVQDFIEKV